MASTLAAAGLLLATAQPAAAALQAIVDSSTGEFFLQNTGGAIQFLDAYEISSPTSDLLTGDWTPIAGNYDLDGDGSVSPTKSWFVLSSSPSALAEAGDVSSGALSPGQIVSLGEVWDTSSPESLGFRLFVDTTESVLTVDYRSLAGDYDGDLDVDALDYTVWTLLYGSTTNLAADGNNDGIVDAADYTVWRDSFVAVAGEAAAASFGPAALVVPEPMGATVLLLTAATLYARRGRSRIA